MANLLTRLERLETRQVRITSPTFIEYNNACHREYWRAKREGRLALEAGDEVQYTQWHFDKWLTNDSPQRALVDQEIIDRWEESHTMRGWGRWTRESPPYALELLPADWGRDRI